MSPMQQGTTLVVQLKQTACSNLETQRSNLRNKIKSNHHHNHAPNKALLTAFTQPTNHHHHHIPNKALLTAFTQPTLQR